MALLVARMKVTGVWEYFLTFFFIKAANFIGGHKLLLYRACYIANLASVADIETEAGRERERR